MESQEREKAVKVAYLLLCRQATEEAYLMMSEQSVAKTQLNALRKKYNITLEELKQYGNNLLRKYRQDINRRG